MKIDTDKWQEFSIEKLFSVRNSKKCSLKKAELCEQGKYNYVSTAATNNGVIGKSDFWNEKGNVITVESACKGYASYQESRFAASHHVEILEPHFEMNAEIAMFFVTLINKESFRYSYGHKLSINLIKKMKLLLPVILDDDGNYIYDKEKCYSDSGYVPDFQYIETYIKSLNDKVKCTIIHPNDYHSERICLEGKNWKNFKICDLFTIKNGKGLYSNELKHHPGNMDVIQGSMKNNGVFGKADEQYIKDMEYTISKGQCLTVARTGNTGHVTFHEMPCAVGGSAKLLELPPDVANKYVYVFLQCILNFNKYKYNFGRKLNKKSFNEAAIMLPIQMDETKNPIIDEQKRFCKEGYIPDWKFMKEFIFRLSNGKI